MVIDVDVRDRDVLRLLGVFLQVALRHEWLDEIAVSKRPRDFGPCEIKAWHLKPSFQRRF